MRFSILLLVLPLLAACGALPAQGPGATAIVSKENQAERPFDVVTLTTTIADTLALNDSPSLVSAFGEGGGSPDLRIGVGDTIIVTIFEAASGGLFSGDAGSLGAASKSVTLPPQPVARTGMISVPYAGLVRAAGMTPAQVAASIEAALREKAIEPQVIVTIANGVSTFVTVGGDVGSPGRIPLSLAGDRILDVIAAAGGSRAPAYNTYVRLTRGSTAVTVSLSYIVANPGQNIFLRPDDQIFVFIDPRTFSAFGATVRNASIPFETDRLTLAEAVGLAGGLIDARANASGVFVFRFETPANYALINDDKKPPMLAAAGVPVVYRLDFKDPTGFFVAQRFVMRDNDILYVSNAPATDLSKFLGLLQTQAGIITTPIGTAEAIRNFGD